MPYILEQEQGKEQNQNNDLNKSKSNVKQLSTPQVGVRPGFADIREGIEKRRFVWIYYKPDGTEKNYKIEAGWRLIEPYVFGQRLQAKPRRYQIKYPYQRMRYYLRAFVIKEIITDVDNNKMKFNTNSVSLTKDEPYWRMFRIDKISSWKPIDFTFNKAKPGFNPNDKDLANIITVAKF